MPDRRITQPRMSPPHKVGKRAVVVCLDPGDYRALYELTLTAGTSMADCLRQLIRDAAQRLPTEEGQ
ncbi:hypothetical protein [Pararhodobacter zhoushanensis]|uniref:Ribbon-helix-helix protein, copG family n=1 Tax=Pararhodobacter zhoushanensis TaxID=2479545 RepID=A0ABT3GYK7_9RHOB|nr:hypothetical protein [Pararhodobacter zhoushanensis]MCW1932651.1 hypothetical protein [Pararhodobacter zhoushanensis]